MSDKSFRELDEVRIPRELAALEKVSELGTIVWYVEGASYATVECALLGEEGSRAQTKFLDVEVKFLRRGL
jgi:hypothetical protein